MKPPDDEICLMVLATLDLLKTDEPPAVPSIGDSALDATGDPHIAGLSPPAGTFMLSVGNSDLF